MAVREITNLAQEVAPIKGTKESAESGNEPANRVALLADVVQNSSSLCL
jgi:hypothetical protein